MPIKQEEEKSQTLEALSPAAQEISSQFSLWVPISISKPPDSVASRLMRKTSMHCVRCSPKILRKRNYRRF